MKKHELKLLTAFVDGELPSSMQNEANELLQNSAEAREFLRLLKQDALMIRNQVPMECSYELTQKILAKIKVRSLSRIGHLNKRDDLMMRPWFSLVAVATILAVTTFISFYAVNAFLIMQENGQGKGQFASSTNQNVENDKNAQADNSESIAKAEQIAMQEKQNLLPVPPELNKENDKSAKMRPLVGQKNKSPDIASKGKELLAAPANETFNLIKVDAPLPWVLRKKDVDGEVSGRVLSKVISHDARLKIELSCKDNAAAFAQLKMNLNKMGYFVYSDVSTLMRLKNKNDKSPVNYMIYLENANVNDLAQLLGQDKPTLAKDAAKVALISSFWEALVVSKLSLNDRKTMKSVLGFEPTEQGGSSLNTTSKPANESNEPAGGSLQSLKKNKSPALAVSFTATQNLVNSPEIKQYFETVKSSNQSGIKVLLVLRTEN
ncbi:MAG: hypothetical protein JHD20_11390 [Gemmataceae bacterium]|nr:hypothetical protein [Gemmataceae bacterium]